jgi:hypothetical protein
MGRKLIMEVSFPTSNHLFLTGIVGYKSLNVKPIPASHQSKVKVGRARARIGCDPPPVDRTAAMVCAHEHFRTCIKPSPASNRIAVTIAPAAANQEARIENISGTLRSLWVLQKRR